MAQNRKAALATAVVLLFVSACQASTPSPSSGGTQAPAGGTQAPAGGTQAPAGGSQAPATPPQATGNLTFCFVGIAGADDHFWAIIIKGATDAGVAAGVKVNYVSPPKFDIPSMVTLTDQCIAAHVNGIVTSLADINAQSEVAKRAVAAGIPITADGSPASKNPADDPFLFWVGSNDLDGGKAGAERILATHKPTGVVCGINEPGNIPVEQRCNGAAEVFQKAGVKLEKIATTNDHTQAGEILKGYLTSHPDVDTYFGGSQPLWTILAENPGSGPITLNLGGKSRVMNLATFDLDPPILDGIKNGQVMFTVDQQAYLRGYMPIILLAQNLRHGFRPATDFLTGPSFIDKASVDAVISQAAAGYR